MSHYITIISSTFLFISEVLPYISQIKGNGIVHSILGGITQYEEDRQRVKLIEHKEVMDKLEEIKILIVREKKE